MSSVGAALNRIDGPLKVCGQARYAAEFVLPRMAYAVIVQSTIANGRIARIDSSAAERSSGVIAVLTHHNALRLPQGGRAGVDPPHGRVLSLLQDDRVHYNGQPVAVVVADTLEHALGAAPAVHVSYEPQPALLDFEAGRRGAYSPGKSMETPADSLRGDVQGGLAQAMHRTSAVYTTPMEHHNPMEPHATLAAWQGNRLSVYDSTQYVAGVQKTLAKIFGIAPQNIRVRSPYVGGAFGGKGSAWSHVVLAAMAARHTGRPVRLALQRPQLFGPVGGRPQTQQTLVLGCDGQGRLTSVEHKAIANTSVMEDWMETSAMVTRMLYSCPNVATSHRLVKLHVGTPTFQRAPGESTGMFALESALDELAYESGIDPIDLRLVNYAEKDEDAGKPFSSKALRECYAAAAKRFDWARRNPRPGSMQEGQWLIGMGMASATRPAKRSPAQARVRLLPDGYAIVQSSTEDLGTGTYTVMTQIAADALGYAPGRIRFELGDTDLAEAPISAGSMTVESVGSAVHAACAQARERLVELARKDVRSPLAGATPPDFVVNDGWLQLASDKTRREPAAALIARNGAQPIEALGHSEPGPEEKQYSMHSFGAVFAEVRVDRDLGSIRIPRVVGAFGVGNLINGKTAHSQLMGGIVWGIGMALFEESVLDRRHGRFVNANLSEYLVPVNADIGDIDITVVPEQDEHVNVLGAKGVGEVSMTGVAAAIANAVYHATGRRVRDLPIRLDKLLG